MGTTVGHVYTAGSPDLILLVFSIDPIMLVYSNTQSLQEWLVFFIEYNIWTVQY